MKYQGQAPEKARPSLDETTGPSPDKAIGACLSFFRSCTSLWPAKDACQVRYLVTADTSLPKGHQTRGCLQVEGSVPGPGWGLSKVVPLLFSLFLMLAPCSIG